MKFNRFIKVLSDETFNAREYTFLEVLELINNNPNELGLLTPYDAGDVLPLYDAKTLKTLIIRGPWSLDIDSVAKCDSLQKIIWLDKTGKSICKKNAFRQLPALREIVLPTKMFQLDTDFFSDCDGVKFIRYPKIIEKGEFKGLGGIIKNYPEVMVDGNLSRNISSSSVKAIAFMRPVSKLYTISAGCPKNTTLRLQNTVDMPIKQATSDRIISASSFLSCKSLTPFTSKGILKAPSEEYESVWLTNSQEDNIYDLD